MGVNQAATLCLKCKAQHDLLLHLIVTLLGQNPALPHHHPDSNQSHQDSMAKIPKHNSKQEWEGDDSIGSCKGKESIPSTLCVSQPKFTIVQFRQFSKYNSPASPLLLQADEPLLEFSIRDFHIGQAMQINIMTKKFETEVLDFSKFELTWIYFSICPNAISINNVLKARSKLVSFVVCGWGLIGLHPV